MVSVQLHDAIADSFAVILDSDCFEVYETPALLQAFVLGNPGAPLDLYLPIRVHTHSRLLPWWLMGTL